MSRTAPAVMPKQLAPSGLATYACVLTAISVICVLGALLIMPTMQPAHAETTAERGGRAIQSLKGLTPLVGHTSDYIADPIAAQQLGKALFWDTQVSTDGTACASCHFHAGVDIRNRNQVSPGLKEIGRAHV